MKNSFVKANLKLIKVSANGFIAHEGILEALRGCQEHILYDTPLKGACQETKKPDYCLVNLYNLIQRLSLVGATERIFASNLPLLSGRSKS